MGVATLSISQLEFLLDISQVPESSHLTHKINHCDFGDHTILRGIILAIVPIYMNTLDSSISKIILKCMPIET